MAVNLNKFVGKVNLRKQQKIDLVKHHKVNLKKPFDLNNTKKVFIKTLAKAEVSFFYHGFVVKEGFYYGEVIVNGSFVHFCTSGWKKDGKLHTYFNTKHKEWSPSWVEIGTQEEPVGMFGQTFWKKVKAYERLEKILKEENFYTVECDEKSLYYNTLEEAQAVFEGEVQAGVHEVVSLLFHDEIKEEVNIIAKCGLLERVEAK